MPAEVVVVRHGQCSGNVADRASYKGNHHLFTTDIRSQKSSQWPLTSTGIKESELAGNWIRDNIATEFDFYFTSDYVRAVQTAKHLAFEGSRWIEDFLLREREWGGAENLPYPEREVLFQHFGVSPTEDSMSWRPPNGESMFTIVGKMRLFLARARATASAKRILLVTHGAPLQAFRVLQHNISPSRYTSFVNGENYLRNCHVFHYSEKKGSADNIPMYSLERSAYLNPDSKWVETIAKT